MSPVQPDGYLAAPSSGKGSPALVLHAWWGLWVAVTYLTSGLSADEETE